MAMTAMVTFRLESEVKEKVEKLAKRTNRSAEFYYNQAIKQYLEDMEDLEDVMRIREEIKSGRMETRSFDDIKKEFGYED